MYRHAADVRADYNLQDVDVLHLTEAHILPTDPTDLYSLPGFDCTPLWGSTGDNSTQRMHGSLLYTRGRTPAQVATIGNVEALAVSLPDDVTFIGVYRPPRSPLFHLLDALKTLLPTAGCRVVLMGEFNTDPTHVIMG